ncbi:MAG TPA: histidine kinase [Gallionella sp.]|nr:histidine kinase [Gallionella sp.]
MQKRTINISDANHNGFSWVRDPEFIPPGKDGGMNACVSHELASPRAGELRALLETFLESIIGTVNATAGVVRLLSPDGCTLQIIGSAGLSAELQEEAESFVELDCEVNDKATFGHVIHASDISTCDSRQNCRYASCRFQSLVAAPLETPDTTGAPLGILTVFFDVHREASSQVMNTIAAFAEVMSAAIEHTRINREISRKERLAARQEIANDIHDSLAQTLTYARMRVSLLQENIRSGNEVAANKHAHDVDEALEIAQKSARELIADFRCELNPGGLLAALHDLTAEFRKHNDIKLEYHNRLVDLELPLEHEIQIFHIVREALTNIARHSGASHARLFVDASFGYYIFTIEDNGGGARTFTPVEGHYGVMIMRERAHRICGEIRVESAAGLGTQVQLFFPEPSQDWRTTNE